MTPTIETLIRVGSGMYAADLTLDEARELRDNLVKALAPFEAHAEKAEPIKQAYREEIHRIESGEGAAILNRVAEGGDS